MKESDYEPGKEVVCMIQMTWRDGEHVCENPPVKGETYKILEKKWYNKTATPYILIKIERCDGYFPAKFFTPADNDDLAIDVCLQMHIDDALSAPVPDKKSIIKEHYLDSYHYITGLPKPSPLSDQPTIRHIQIKHPNEKD